MKNLFSGLLLAVLSLLLFAAAIEVYVRVTESDGENFDIEMWRYAKDLKQVEAKHRAAQEERFLALLEKVRAMPRAPAELGLSMA